jgi:ATP-binding cassette subfamily B protein
VIKGRTTLVIAHRLHTIAQADMIHVVEKGTIVESGRHTELLARSGRYAHFHRMRFESENRPVASELID